MKTFTKLIHKNILILPSIILAIGIIVFAFVMYEIEAQKSESIERQQAFEYQQKQEQAKKQEAKNAINQQQRSACAEQALASAKASYDFACKQTGFCKPGEGMYYRDGYEKDFKNCLMKAALFE